MVLLGRIRLVRKLNNVPIFFGLSLPRIQRLNLCCQRKRQITTNEDAVSNLIQTSNESKYVIAAGLEFYVSDTLKMLKKLTYEINHTIMN